jgi:chromosome segregation ATPase
MSGVTKAELFDLQIRAVAEAVAATDAALNAKRERDLARSDRRAIERELARVVGERDAARGDFAAAEHDLNAMTTARDTALHERDMARRQLQETLTSEQQLRAAFKLTGHLNAGLRKQLDAERETRSRVEGELRKEAENLRRLLHEAPSAIAHHGQLARITQTSHDREAALLNAITALARRTP